MNSFYIEQFLLIKISLHVTFFALSFSFSLFFLPPSSSLSLSLYYHNSPFYNVKVAKFLSLLLLKTSRIVAKRHIFKVSDLKFEKKREIRTNFISYNTFGIGREKCRISILCSSKVRIYFSILAKNFHISSLRNWLDSWLLWTYVEHTYVNISRNINIMTAFGKKALRCASSSLRNCCKIFCCRYFFQHASNTVAKLLKAPTNCFSCWTQLLIGVFK